ncbi:MAG TPA: hypothetical protein VIN03_16730 [Roseateles sp.]
MPIDASIALGYKPTDGLQSLSSVLNIQGQQQNLQAQKLQMQGAQQQNEAGAIKLNETKALQPFLADHRNYTDEAGNVDQAKLYQGIMSLAPTTGAERISQIGQMQQAMTTAQNSIMSLNTAKRSAVGNILTSVDGADPEVAHKTLDVISKMHPELGDAIKLARHLYDNTPKEERGETFKTFARAVLPQDIQQNMNTPAGVEVDNGQQAAVVSTKPGTMVPVGQALPGTRVQKQLPPGTPVMGRDEAGNPTPGYLGPQPGRPGSPEARGSEATPARNQERMAILQDEYNKATNQADKDAIQREMKRLGGAPRASGFVASGLPVGQAENISNNLQEMNRHFGGLQDQAAGSQLVAGLTGNIKALANKAITGTNNDKLAFANGLLAQLGIGKSEDLKTATDLLEKNMAQLNLGSGGGTDAARALVQAARPNSHMSPEAINEAADQVAGQIRANVAMRNMLMPLKLVGDAEGYSKMRAKLESIADPRAFQFANYSPAEQAEMLKRLTSKDRAELRSKIEQLEAMHMFGR